MSQGEPMKSDDALDRPRPRGKLSKAAKRCMKAARRRGKRIDWEEARSRGWTWLMKMHFPWFRH